MENQTRSTFLTIAFCLFALLSSESVWAQKDVYKVAIFLYEGVELLDFAGPGEVFGATSGFDVFTVSVDGGEILSQGFVTIKPQYSIENSPAADVLIFPGGNSGPSSKDQRVLNWIKKHASNGAQILTVCTGAGIVGQTGLLEGLNITTWYGYIPALQTQLPKSTVLKDTRFVDSGSIITTAGVSAGIDGALHLLARIKGLDVAKSTAQYMEYDKWNPDDGKIDYSNTVIQDLSERRLSAAEVKTVPYEGEFINAARALVETSDYEKAEALTQAALTWYPNSVPMFETLGTVYRSLGKKAPPSEGEFLDLLAQGKIETALEVYKTTQEKFPGWRIFSENNMNIAGYQLLSKGEIESAIRVLELNVDAYPDSFNVYDSLGEAFLNAGDTEKAIANYKKSLALNPNNENARNVLSKIKTGS